MATSRSRRRAASSAPAAAGHKRRVRLAALLIAVAGFIVYANSLEGPFIFDDHRSILENPTIRWISPITAVLQPPRQTPVTGRPIANLSFAMNFAIGGLRVEGYHLWNIAVHLLTALTLFGVLRRLVPRMSVASQESIDRLAFVCAMVWMVHPLNTEAVNYITQRTESMMGLFYLLTLYASIRAWDTKASGRWYALAVIANLCGVCTKESMITAPVIIVLCDRIFSFPSFRSAFRQRASFYAALASAWLVFGMLSLQTPFFSDEGFDAAVSRWTYIVNQPPVIAHYLRLSIWPIGLILDYGVPQSLTLTDVWPSAALILTLSVVTVIALIRVPTMGFWGAWFFVTLAPASSVIPIPTEVGAERRMYLPLVAVIVVLIVPAWRLAARLAARPTSPLPRGSRTALVAILVASLSALTVARNAEYQSGLSLWQTVIARRPHPRAHTNLAVQLRDAGRDEEAIEHLKIAAPDWPDARHPLGSALLERGDVRGAVTQLEEFIRLRPQHPQTILAREELAAALMRQGDNTRALAEFRQIVSMAPQYVRGHLNLGNMLLLLNDVGAAAAEFRECLKLDPENIRALTQLGTALASAGDGREAAATFQRVLQLDPRLVAVRKALLDVLLKLQRFPELEAESRRVLASSPNDADAHNLLGAALASQQRLDEAIQHFNEAIRLRPQFPQAQNNLRFALELKRRSVSRSRP